MRRKNTIKNPEYYLIGKVKVSVTNIGQCIEKIIEAKEGQSKYICVGNVRTIVLGNKNKKYQNTINDAFMNLPDGMPLVWAGHLAGAKAIRRTSGPDLFSEFLKEKYPVKHYLLGDTGETIKTIIDKINKLYPKTIISGFYSPPFEPLEKFDFENIAYKIKDSGADIVWVAIGAPKQDYLSAELVKYCNRGTFIGVGAAFRFFIGEYKHPPRLFQIIGFEGIFWRFFRHPLKQFIWYCKHIPQYLWLLTKLSIPDSITK